LFEVSDRLDHGGVQRYVTVGRGYPDAVTLATSDSTAAR
jgi:hypothetical protein